MRLSVDICSGIKGIPANELETLDKFRWVQIAYTLVNRKGYPYVRIERGLLDNIHIKWYGFILYLAKGPPTGTPCNCLITLNLDNYNKIEKEDGWVVRYL